MKFSRIALLGAATIAIAQPHNHVHRHPARHASPVQGRDANVVTVAGPVETVYELNGETISWDEVEAGIASGKYVIVGGQISSVASAAPVATTAPASTPTPSAASTSVQAAAFVEKKPSSSEAASSSTAAPSSTYVAPTTSASKAATSSASSSGSSSSGSSSSGSVGDWPDFPSGTIDCSDFDSLTQYGPINVDWTGLGGYTGVQNTPDFGGLGVSAAISYIETAISGSTCTTNSFCSYACPAGYQKSQWPAAQGSTGQSIGGLYCNSNGKLELSRTSTSQLCIAGTGGVTVSSSVGKVISICRTDYPGTESETVPLAVNGGDTYPLTCPDASTYYFWEGKGTSAQYYLNPSGYEPSDACQWNTAGSNLGNYSPTNMGVGQSDGITYISLFQNSPTNTDGVLDYSINITGDISGTCSYSNGVYLKDGSPSATGCTVAVSSGGNAVIAFS